MVERHLLWGTLTRASLLGPHFAVLGTTGSGKTLTLNMLMRSALIGFEGEELLHRALVYDHKTDLYPVLRSMGIPAKDIAIMNPFDVRSTAWDIAVDVRTRSDAAQIASAFVPISPGEKNRFFYEATRLLLGEVIWGLHLLSKKARETWTLLDLVDISRDDKLMERVLCSNEHGTRLHRRVFESPDTKTLGGILYTLETKMAPMATVASLWSHAKKATSINAWLDGRSVILLPNRAEASEALVPINKALLALSCSKVATRPEVQGEETWVFLDELRALGAFDKFDELLLTGRSRGARIAIGFQDIQGLRHAWGRELADEIIDQCGNLAILRVASPDSMQWAANYASYYEDYKISSSWGGSDKGGGSWGRNKSVEKREAILPQEFRFLPPAGEQYGIPGFFFLPMHSGKGPGWKEIEPFVPPRFLGAAMDQALIERPGEEQEAPVIDDERLGDLAVPGSAGKTVEYESQLVAPK